MKRSDELIPLSHDHHQALYVAKLLRDAESVDVSTVFIEFWSSHGAAHFRIEEEVLLPFSGLAGPTEDEDVGRMLDEHLDLRRQAREVVDGKATVEDLKQLGSALFDHVRFEERQLFPRIESTLSPDGLKLLGVRLAEAESPD